MIETPLLPTEIELQKSRRLLDAAAHLEAGGFHDDAVSRAYYAVFHAGCALLSSIGRSVRSHDGLRATIGEHFIRPGLLDGHFARILARTAADRNDADYNSVASFEAEDAREAIAHGREFLAAVERILAAPTPPSPAI